MSFGGALQIGRSGLLASQAALETTGNNLANIATRGYHRQTVAMSPLAPQQLRNGIFIGRGVQITAITRQINEALEARLRTSISDEARSSTRQAILQQIEAVQNELSGYDLSTNLSAFFNAFSQLANNPQDNSLRTLALQQGQSLASFIVELRNQYGSLRTQVERAAEAQTVAANDLLQRIEQITMQIVKAEGAQGGAAGLRDERDLLLAELAKHIDISVNEFPTGTIDVFVGSQPIMLAGRSRGLELRTRVIDSVPVTEVVISDDKSRIDVSSGELGALIRAKSQDVQHAIDTLDQLAQQLIWQVNRIHSQGQGLRGYTSVTGTNRVSDINVPLNQAGAGLAFTPQHGSFLLHVTQVSTGERQTVQINIDLDNVDPANNTTLADLVAQINGVANVDASITAGNQLRLAGLSDDFQLSFSEDSSGILAALGINTYFTGSDARDIAVNTVLMDHPGLLAAAQDHLPGDNRTALALAGMRDQRLGELGGLSLTEFWGRHVEDLAIRHGQSIAQVQADSIVRENLEAQQQSVSGVNADEEAINLLAFQRAYQGSARFIAVVDEMLQTLMALV